MKHNRTFSTRTILFFLLLFPATQAFAQDSEPISTDRPDQSDGVYTLPKNAFQLETGLLYGKESDDYFFHNTMLRYGLFNKTEVRLEIDYGRQFGITGLLPTSISIKQALIEQNGLLPAISAIGSVALPFLSSSEFRPDKVPLGLTLAFENELSDHFSLAYNLGGFGDGYSDELNWLVTANLGYSPIEKVSFFLEYFATYADGIPPDHNADMGVLWLLKNNLQLDIAAGTSLFRNSSGNNRFVTIGFSYRFDH